MQILSVTDLTRLIKAVFDSEPVFQHVWIRGEISNCKQHSSGHWYLTLKDAEASLKAVMFRGPAAGLRFRPDNGMKVIALGRISLYPRDGQYQLYIDELQPDGIGALHLAYEQLKGRLSAEGLFSESRKRTLPHFPRTIGLVTSPTGAAIRDLLSVIQRRMPGIRIFLVPVLVQGAGAAEDIAHGIERLNQWGEVDVMIVGRGGGSVEDLWSFNEEIVARAIAASEIPVVSAVGHETDLTIADLVADFRAPTPSAAAEIVVPDYRELSRRILNAQLRLVGMAERMVTERRINLENLMRRSTFTEPSRWLDVPKERVDRNFDKLLQQTKWSLSNKRVALQMLATQLEGLSPLAILNRGYAICRKEGQVVRTTDQLEVGSPIEVILHHGTVWGTVLSKSD